MVEVAIAYLMIVALSVHRYGLKSLEFFFRGLVGLGVVLLCHKVFDPTHAVLTSPLLVALVIVVTHLIAAVFMAKPWKTDRFGSKRISKSS